MAQIDTLATVAKEAQFSGIVTIDQGPHRILEFTAGYANRAHKIPNMVSTRFGIASGSKGFTALAVMSLIEADMIELDTRVRAVLHDDIPGLDPEVTVRHLLSHTSGIEDYLDESDDWDVTDYVLDVPTHTLTSAEAFLPLLRDLGQLQEPAEGFHYSNASYIILAIIIERLTGETFHDVVERTVFQPAGMTQTGFDRMDELGSDVALGYLDDRSDRVNVLHLPVRGNGDGGAFTTAGDMHAFWQALFDGQIVNRESLATVIAPLSYAPEEELRYGMGFWLEKDGPGVLLEGYDPGVSFRSTHNPDTATTTTVIGNTSEGAWPMIGATLSGSNT